MDLTAKARSLLQIGSRHILIPSDVSTQILYLIKITSPHFHINFIKRLKEKNITSKMVKSAGGEEK